MVNVYPIQQCENYIALIGRVISSKIKFLHCLQDVAMAHIPHKYMKEMALNLMW